MPIPRSSLSSNQQQQQEEYEQQILKDFEKIETVLGKLSEIEIIFIFFVTIFLLVGVVVMTYANCRRLQTLLVTRRQWKREHLTPHHRRSTTTPSSSATAAATFSTTTRPSNNNNSIQNVRRRNRQDHQESIESIRSDLHNMKQLQQSVRSQVSTLLLVEKKVRDDDHDDDNDDENDALTSVTPLNGSHLRSRRTSRVALTSTLMSYCLLSTNFATAVAASPASPSVAPTPFLTNPTFTSSSPRSIHRQYHTSSPTMSPTTTPTHQPTEEEQRMKQDALRIIKNRYMLSIHILRSDLTYMWKTVF